MELTLNTVVDISISQSELNTYRNMERSKHLKEVGAALLQLVEIIHTSQPENWTAAAAAITAKPQGKYSDDKLASFVGFGLTRCLQIAAAIQKDHPSSQMWALCGAITSNYFPMDVRSLDIQVTA